MTLDYADESELDRKCIAILTARGYRVERANPERTTVGALAKQLGRPVSTISASLRRPSCPEYVAKRGNLRIVWIEPNDKLLAFLGDWRKGQRSPPAPP